MDDPPYVLVFRVDDVFHVRFAQQRWLSGLPPARTPEDLLSREKGIAPASPAFLALFGILAQTPLDLLSEQAKLGVPELFDPRSIIDGRQRVVAEVLRRMGQQQFRRKLLSAYSNQCAITRCRTLWVLEAAHITPYRGSKTNAVSNGLLLRADVHTLFDLALMAICPRKLTVSVSSQLSDSEYIRLDGTKLALPKDPGIRPSALALEEHYSLFQQ